MNLLAIVIADKVPVRHIYLWQLIDSKMIDSEE